MTAAMRMALLSWCDALLAAPVRLVPLLPGCEPVFLWTDGCCATAPARYAGLGAVMVDRVQGIFETWGCEIPDDLKSIFIDDGGSEQVIAQAELLPVWFPACFGAGH